MSVSTAVLKLAFDFRRPESHKTRVTVITFLANKELNKQVHNSKFMFLKSGSLLKKTKQKENRKDEWHSFISLPERQELFLLTEK